MVPSEVFILSAAVQVSLSAYMFFLNPKSKLNIGNAMIFIASAYFSFVEHEIAINTTYDNIFYLSNKHAMGLFCLLFMAVANAWIFANPFQYKKQKIYLTGVIFFLFSLFPILFFSQNWNNSDVLGSHVFLSADGWKYRRTTNKVSTILFLSNTWFSVAFVLFSICFYIAYKKERHTQLRYWKKILFIFFSIAPILLFYHYHLSVIQATSKTGDYTMSFYIFLFIIGLTYVFQNFKLFEVGPVKALDNILNSMSNLVVITDTQLNITYCNTVFQQAFPNIAKEDFEGISLMKILRRSTIFKAGMDNAEHDITAINSLLFQERIERDITVCISCKVCHYLFVVSPIYHKKQNKTGYSFVGTDLTHLKESEIQFRKYAEQLENSNRELERFAFIASHDLKTPLRNVISFLSLIKRKAKEMEHEPEEYLNFAITNAKNMYNLIEDILEFSRTRNSSEEQFEMVDLNRVIVLVRQNLSQQIEEKNIIIESDTLPTIQANPTRILQLFQNLVENGLKYNKSEFPTVKITCTATSDGAYKFFICDNGIGILPEYQDTIFELFKRLHTQSEYPGSGLGLAISKKIAEQYGGDITLESNPPNGSIFMVTLRDITAPNHLYHQNSRMAKQLNN